MFIGFDCDGDAEEAPAVQADRPEEAVEAEEAMDVFDAKVGRCSRLLVFHPVLKAATSIVKYNS